ncbi:hypothetical protein Phum_PHUM576010 [Pediculus humanus corporis]|uniref:Uncharacterized protein n=1 Tax=Pediculus humanus subsp. corporis TaxID=121224 RepID=E0W1E3_PEDHC|nr:uncharacterized protein Phum_PHUM576010 [Pediculus humanus corporis]EEB19449.1 hypothetical protein Phum_PHUM576010 [Pediculus humanus corporis]
MYLGGCALGGRKGKGEIVFGSLDRDINDLDFICFLYYYSKKFERLVVSGQGFF